jgi:TorA maturation chaperone TorD
MSVMIQTDELVQRAGWFKVFSLLFRYPNEEALELLKAGVAELPVEVLGTKMRTNADSFKRAIADATPDQITREYSALFTGAGLCRSNENDYEKLSFSMTEKLADVAGFYGAFGFEVRSDIGERPDFIGAELDFINLLLLKQAYAVQNNWAEQANISADAVRSFLETHFINWVPKLCYSLGELATNDGIYARASGALAAMVESENIRLAESSK